MAAEPGRGRARWWLAALLCLPLAQAQGQAPFDIPAAQPARAIGPDYFGTHFHRLDHASDGFPATAWPGELVGSMRLWDSGTRWADLEPAPDRFDFARLDELVDQARAHGAEVLMVLGSPPAWAAARPLEPGPYGPGSAAEPRDLALWDRYVGAVAQRYRGRISQYELWNEPYFSDLPQDRGHPDAFFSGSVATMVALARRARAAIARADPRASLLTPGFVGAPNRLDLFLKAGGGRYVDGVAYHFYAEDGAEFVRLAASVRGVMARDGLGGRKLYDTESGFALRGVEGQPLAAGQPPIDRRRAAALLAQTMVLGAWLGIDRFYQYAWDNGRMGMRTPDGRSGTDSLRAYAAVRRWLLGTTPGACHAIGGDGVRCEGTRDGQRLIVAWKTEGDGAPVLVLPEGVHAIAIEQAVDGPLGPSALDADRVPLPAGGMPLAIWISPVGGTRHTRAMQSR